jgi:integrase
MDDGKLMERTFQTHDLRKSYICEMFKENYDIEDIKKRASHKQITVTINNYIEGHRKGYLEYERDSKGSIKPLKNITLN